MYHTHLICDFQGLWVVCSYAMCTHRKYPFVPGAFTKTRLTV